MPRSWVKGVPRIATALRTTLLTALVTLALCAAARITRADLILNGDFENNTAVSSMFNISNATFNAVVASATAFGNAEEIDLITGEDFGIAPQSGSWKLGIHTQPPTRSDALSLTLASPLVTGSLYGLSFYAAQSPHGLPGPVEIGLSTNAVDFGTLIFTSTTPASELWTHYTSSFAAPFAASFLTVRNALTTDIYNSVDNFSLNGIATTVPEPSYAAMLFGLGFAAFSARVWRRRVD